MDPNCEQYDGDICTKCKNFFSLLNSNLPCFYTDQNCKLLGNNRCNECHDGYYLHFDGYCGLNPVFCVEVDSFGVCRKCQDNYDFENGVCVFQEIQIPDCFQVR